MDRQLLLSRWLQADAPQIASSEELLQAGNGMIWRMGDLLIRIGRATYCNVLSVLYCTLQPGPEVAAGMA